MAVVRDVADLVATLVAILMAILVATRVAVTLVATLQGEVPQLLLSSQAPGLIMEEGDPMEAHMEGAPMVHTLLGLLVLCVGEVGRVRIIGWLKYSPQLLKQSLNIEQLIRKAFDASIEQQ